MLRREQAVFAAVALSAFALLILLAMQNTLLVLLLNVVAGADYFCHFLFFQLLPYAVICLVAATCSLFMLAMVGEGALRGICGLGVLVRLVG